jgi:16S rRNA (cytosine1402-N4)-methyltransferase
VRLELTPDGVPPLGGPLVDGVVLDVGVSSMQIDRPERGFSFQSDGPLDMRMSQSGNYAGPSAADVVNTLDADPLADILYRYGDEKRSRQIAKAIVMDRAKSPFTRTKQLADMVCRVLKTPKIDGRHAATRTFQALRIHVNDELGELERGLVGAERLLKPGGRLVVVTFHSLEDRIVKEFLRERAGRLPQGSRHGPAVVQTAPPPTFTLEVARAIPPGEAETASNPRARSARLRWAVRTEAAPWSTH